METKCFPEVRVPISDNLAGFGKHGPARWVNAPRRRALSSTSSMTSAETLLIQSTRTQAGQSHLFIGQWM